MTESNHNNTMPTIKKRPSMQQVAAFAGVSRSTVSSVLNNRKDCFASKSTRDAVFDAVAQLGYRPNLNATSLAKGKSMTLGVMLNGMGIDPVTRFFESFEIEARKRGYFTLMTSTPNDPELEATNLCWLEDRDVDGVLCIPSEAGDHKQLLELAQRGIAVATYDAASRLNFPVDDISVDHFAGGRMMAEHLIGLGRRRICIAQFSHLCWVVEQRIAGIRSVMREAGLPAPEVLSLSVEARAQGCWSHTGRCEMHQFFANRRGQIDAVAAVGDIIAHGVGGILKQVGVRIPEDIAIVGYDGSNLAASPLLPLTTIHNPADIAGRTAVEMLLDQITHRDSTDTSPSLDSLGQVIPTERPPRQPRQVELMPKLIVRESSVGAAALPPRHL